MIITLMGPASSGKSFLARALASHYGLKHYSMGDMRREAAQERGLTIAEFNKLGETEDTDTIFDNYQKKLGETSDDFVVDGRMSAYFIPNAVKVYVDASEKVRAKRMLQVDPEHVRVGEDPKSIDEAISIMRERTESDKARYERHYGFDPYDKSHYDIVLDTSDLDKDASVSELIHLIDSRKV